MEEERKKEGRKERGESEWKACSSSFDRGGGRVFDLDKYIFRYTDDATGIEFRQGKCRLAIITRTGQSCII